MEGVLLGFSIVLVITGIGLLAAVLLPRETTTRIQQGLTPTIYYVTNPALMVLLVAEAPLQVMVEVFVPVALLSALGAALIYALISHFFRRRSPAQTAVGAMSASYVNAGNIGVPIALYAVGSTTPVVAVLLAQLLIIAPLYLTLFSRLSHNPETPGRPTWKRILGSIANPVTVGTAAGVVLAATGWHLPEVLWTPIEMVGQSSIPLLLILFGMSLAGQRPFRERSVVPDILVATVVKLAVMPALAWAVGYFVFDLTGVELLGVTVMGALPTAQNVYLFAGHFQMPQLLAREIIFSSACLSLPAVLLVALILR